VKWAKGVAEKEGSKMANDIALSLSDIAARINGGKLFAHR